MEYAPPSGSSLRRNPTKNSNSTPISTGGTPCRRMNGVAAPRIQSGARCHAAIAPNRLPMTKLRTVVTIKSPIVHGSASRINSITVVGYLLSE